jgi:hypothetical protein
MDGDRRGAKESDESGTDARRPFLIRRATADMYDCRSIKRANLAGIQRAGQPIRHGITRSRGRAAAQARPARRAFVRSFAAQQHPTSLWISAFLAHQQYHGLSCYLGPG